MAERAKPGCLATGVGIVGVVLLLGTLFGGSEDKRDSGAPPAADVKRIGTAMKWQTTPPRDPDALVQPAPPGLPARVALTVIREAGHPCKAVATALRYPSDGAISATCSGGERYLVFTAKDVGPAAMSCAAMKRLLGRDCVPSTLKEAVAAGLN